ncbi:MAG: DUF3800 domain-containing protein [Armatimonadetes bacterium]|nr:DUF3800 domain-containing protein [Armatimonadota bacterium]
MLYLYLDESGDLGFDFVNKKPSKFFTIAILAVSSAEGKNKIAKSIKLTLRRKFKNSKSKADELKGSKCPIEIKKYLYSFVKNIDFSIYSITLNKLKLYENLRKDRERVYNYIARLVMDKIDFTNKKNGIEIIIDKSKPPKSIFEFNQYIIKQIKSRIDPRISLNIHHCDSKENLCLQAVDLFCWGIFRKYEKVDSSWFNIYKSKVKYETLYFSDK